jgi:hypothetical protein
LLRRNAPQLRRCLPSNCLLAFVTTLQLNIINSFGFMFTADMPNIRPHDVRISMRGSMAYVSCDEVVEPRFEPGMLKTNFQEINPNFSDEPAQVAMASINVYVRKNGQYLLAHHSSSYRSPINF